LTITEINHKVLLWLVFRYILNILIHGNLVIVQTKI